MAKFCSLFSGSSGNCLFLSSGSFKLLIDSGLSAKRIVGALDSIGESPSELSAIIISHEHSDHIKGAGIVSRKFDIPIYANEKTWQSMLRWIGPVDAKNIKYFQTGSSFEIGDIHINSFAIPHDALEPVGFRFSVFGKNITVATDIGHMNDELLGQFKGSDLLFLESNHDVEMLKMGRYPWHLKKRILGDFGHLSNQIAGETIAHMALAGTKKFVLGHLSRENNFPELAYQTVCNVLKERNICIKNDIWLDIASRDNVGVPIEIC